MHLVGLGQVWGRPRTDKDTGMREAHETGWVKRGFWKLPEQRWCLKAQVWLSSPWSRVQGSRFDPRGTLPKGRRAKPSSPPALLDSALHPPARLQLDSSISFPLCILSRAFLEAIPWAKGVT